MKGIIDDARERFARRWWPMRSQATDADRVIGSALPRPSVARVAAQPEKESDENAEKLYPWQLA
jgi:hypothetical protein